MTGSTLLASGVATLVLLVIVGLVVRALVNAGREQERADRADADAKITKRQGEVMAEDRTVDDASKRLDAGTF